jgi:hypothetical protein
VPFEILASPKADTKVLNTFQEAPTNEEFTSSVRRRDPQHGIIRFGICRDNFVSRRYDTATAIDKLNND